MNQKNIVAILGVAVVILLGTIIYQHVSQSVPTPVVQNQPTMTQPTPIAQSVTNQELVAKSIDETANWQTYSNVKYGIEMKYPQANWKIYSDINAIFIEKKKEEKETEYNTVTISISENERTVDQIISGPHSVMQEQLKNAKKIKINEIEAYKTKQYEGWFNIWIFDKNYAFEINLPDTISGNLELNKILSTLKFTK